MKPNRSPLRVLALLAVLLLGLSLVTRAQETQQPSEGVNSGNYNIRQTVEFGVRFKEISGNMNVYNTFLNLNPGPRLLEHTLEMRSLNHQGWLFDNLSLSSFGYGGDPNDVTRLRMYKNKWYNFSGTFRRDRNFWDYNLLANPLNPAISTLPLTTQQYLNNTAPPGFSPIVDISPHRFETTRRMSDFDLTLLPQSRLRFRLGYSRNISEGPSFSSFHEGTDVLLFQDWKSTLNSYRVGVDFKFIPRTNISYDQFLHYYKGDTSWIDQNQTFQLSNGTPVDIGLPFNTLTDANGNALPGSPSQPCAAPFNPSPQQPTAPTGTVNATCNGYLLYQRAARVRIPYPTEQLSFQSNYIKSVDLSGRFVYSSSDGDVPIYNEFFGFDQNRTGGLVTRTRQRQFTISGPAKPKRISVSADAGGTVHITQKLRVLDMFRFANFRIPGDWVFSETSLFSTSMLVTPNVFTPGSAPPANCPTATSSGCPQHNSSSPADIISGTSGAFLGQDLKNNLFEVQYDFNQHYGARIGFRYRHRLITHRDATDEDLLFFPGGPVPTPPTGAPPFPWTQFGLPSTGTLAVRGACAWVAIRNQSGTITGWTLPPECVDSATGLARLQPDGSLRGSSSESGADQTEINEYSGVFGVWLRPINELRVNFDLELMSADNAFTRIAPRQLQHYKLRANYRPASWAMIGATANILESRNNVPDINNLQHNRSYGVLLAFEPNERFAFDFGYDYNDVFSQILVCYVSSTAPSGLLKCGTTTLLQDNAIYHNRSHFGYFNTMWKPWKRVRANLGYAITSAAGHTLILNPNAPPGPLNFNYHKPYAGFDVELAKGWSWKVNWGYYGYNEKESATRVDFTGPRDFRGNLVLVSVRYAF